VPLTKSAIKKMKQDAKKRAVNRVLNAELKQLTKEAYENPSSELVNKTYSLIDKAAKRGLIHKNTANRKKSLLSKKIAAKTTSTVKGKSKAKSKS